MPASTHHFDLIDLFDLKAFYWVVQFQSFRRAAEKLNKTPPVISERIAKLEDLLGVKLIDRGARESTPTPKGRQLFAYAERMLALLAEIAAAVADPSALSGVMRLGAAETIVHTWLNRLVERVHQIHPNLTLDQDTDVSPNLTNALIEGQIDLALMLGPVSHPSMMNFDLCRYPLAFVAGAALDLGPEPITLDRLTSRPIITYPKTTRPYIELRQNLERANRTNPRIFGCSSLSTIIRMTLDGIGVSVIPPIVIAPELKRGELRVVNAELPLPELVFTATMVRTPGVSLAERIAEMAQQVAREATAANR